MIVAEQIDAELAQLVSIVPAPAEPFYYGRELACVTDCTPNLDTIDPASEVAIVYALARRLTTERGELPDAPDYGFNLAAYLNAGFDASRTSELLVSIQNECLKDDRVKTIDTQLSFTGKRLDIAITAIPYDPLLNPVSLTFALVPGTSLVRIFT